MAAQKRLAKDVSCSARPRKLAGEICKFSFDSNANTDYKVRHVRHVSEALRVTLQRLTETDSAGENVVNLRVLDCGRNGWFELRARYQSRQGRRVSSSRGLQRNRSGRGIVAEKVWRRIQTSEFRTNFESRCRENGVRLK